MMFNFLRKRTVESIEEDVSKGNESPQQIATVTYHVDKDGFIWVDCFWSGKQEGSHVAFADLLEKISNGELLGSTMEFIESNCDTEEKKIAYDEVVETVLRLQQKRLFDVMNEATLPSMEMDEEPVVSPINVVNMGK